MPFKRCANCGSEFLAKTDDVTLCKPNCAGAKIHKVDVIAAKSEDSSWFFFVLFILFCIATFYCHQNAYEVELYLIQQDVLRETMANKLTGAMPDSFAFVNDALADPDLEVAITCLEAINENVKVISADSVEAETFINMIKTVYQDPAEDLRLKKACVTAMGLIKSDEFVALLRTAITSDQYRYAAVKAMQKIPNELFVSSLTDIAIDSSGRFAGQPVRFQAVIALSLIEERDGDVIPGLLSAFRDQGSVAIRDEAFTGIINFCKRYESLSLSGEEVADAAFAELKRRSKGDQSFIIKRRGIEELPALEQIMKK